MLVPLWEGLVIASGPEPMVLDGMQMNLWLLCLHALLEQG
jgi:hypothetical protein